MITKHTQMPHDLGLQNTEVKLKPVDKLVYVYLRSHCDSSNKTFVSIDVLAKECEINWRTVSESIARLLRAQEIFLVADKNGTRSKTYQINKDSRHFEIFSQECLDYLKENKFTTNEKCVLICMHEFTYKTKNYGETEMSLEEISNKINMPIASLKRAAKSLKEKGCLTIQRNKEAKLVRRIPWEKIMMDTVYQVKENTEDIKTLKSEMKEMKERMETLAAENKRLNYIISGKNDSSDKQQTEFSF